MESLARFSSSFLSAPSAPSALFCLSQGVAKILFEFLNGVYRIEAIMEELSEVKSHSREKLSQKARLFLGLAVFYNLVTTWIGAIQYRFLMHDGAPAVLYGMDGHSRTFDGSFARYFHSYLQIPALALTKLLGKYYYFQVFLNTLAVTYWAFPVLGLGLSYFLLAYANRKDFFIFVLLSFALASQSTLSNVYGLVLDNLVFFWPCFILVAILPVFTKNSLLAATLILLSWCFSHESSIFCIVFIGILTAVRLMSVSPRRKKEDGESQNLKALLFFCFLACAWIFYRVLGPTHGDNQYFMMDLGHVWGPFRVGCLFLALGWVGFAISSFLKKRLSPRFLLFWSLGVALFFMKKVMGAPGHILYWDSVDGRTSAMPFCILVAFIALFDEMRKKGPRSKTSEGSRPFLEASVAMALFFAGFNDMYRDIHWNIIWKGTAALLEASSGCSEFSLYDTNPLWVKLKDQGVDLGTYGALSILVGKSKTVSKIVFSKSPDNHEVQEYCCAFKAGYLPLYLDAKKLDFKYFDFSSALSSVARQRLHCSREEIHATP